MRESEARDLAARADLLMFVVDHDLIRTEYEPLVGPGAPGEAIDRRPQQDGPLHRPDREAILAKLRERLRGLVPPEDVVAGAAAPRPIAGPRPPDDGTTETILEPQPPEIDALRDRIAADPQARGRRPAGRQPVAPRPFAQPQGPGPALRRSATSEAEAGRSRSSSGSRPRPSFANPFPALELLANGAVQFQMISELADVYGVTALNLERPR